MLKTAIFRSAGRAREKLVTWGQEIPYLIRFSTQAVVNTAKRHRDYRVIPAHRGSRHFLFERNQHEVTATIFFFSSDSEEDKNVFYRSR